MIRVNHLNRESKSLDITNYLYRCYEHEAPISFNATVYLSWLLHLEDVLGEKFTLGEFTPVNMKNVVIAMLENTERSIIVRSKSP